MAVRSARREEFYQREVSFSRPPHASIEVLLKDNPAVLVLVSVLASCLFYFSLMTNTGSWVKTLLYEKHVQTADFIL